MPTVKTYEKKLGMTIRPLDEITDPREREQAEVKYRNYPPYKHKGKLFATQGGLPVCVPDQWAENYTGPFLPLPKRLKVKEIG